MILFTIMQIKFVLNTLQIILNLSKKNFYDKYSYNRIFNCESIFNIHPNYSWFLILHSILLKNEKHFEEKYPYKQYVSKYF